MRFSILFLIIYRVRSKFSVLVEPVMNICLMLGSVADASFPRMDELTGTLRKCIRFNPSRSISSIMTLSMCDCSCSSLGRKTSPVPYFPFSGTGMPCKRMNSWGIWSMMPAPSPVLLSAPSAPRCFMFSNTLRAESTNSWDLLPWMSTIMPTPHASCSFEASYNPLVLWICTFASLIPLYLIKGFCFSCFIIYMQCYFII